MVMETVQYVRFPKRSIFFSHFFLSRGDGMGSKISLVLLTIKLVLLTDGGRAVFPSAVGNHHQHQVYVVSCMY
jgi:hypothetical protein